ncbi:AGAP002747-PA [Anopheles gambiae str. PEST]|uniref:AGAP002747-PA n=1 Tax=Anopheles gambiae TaxID=7165 RepID=A0ND06_ANOGA|nr:AGAP002747-PA [Anopheles gambiae str. PEST]
METIKLKTKDGKVITAKRHLLKKSSVLEKKLEELAEEASSEVGTIMNVPEADENSLRNILQWLERCERTTESEGSGTIDASEEAEIPNNQEQNMDRNTGSGETGATFDKEYFTNFRQFCVMIAVANRLQVQEFVDAAVRFVIEWKQDKSLDEIRGLLERQELSVRPRNPAATGSSGEQM